MTEPVAEAVAEAPAEKSVQNTNETMNANVIYRLFAELSLQTATR